MRDEIVEEIRKRGINFPLTDGRDRWSQLRVATRPHPPHTRGG
jgi:hypothetical protein